MIIIEMPTWLALIIVISLSLLLCHLITAEFFTNLIHKKYDLELKEIKKKKEIIEKFKETKDE